MGRGERAGARIGWALTRTDWSDVGQVMEVDPAFSGLGHAWSSCWRTAEAAAGRSAQDEYRREEVTEAATGVGPARTAPGRFRAMTVRKSWGPTCKDGLHAGLPTEALVRRLRAKVGGVDGTRTRGLRRDRPAF